MQIRNTAYHRTHEKYLTPVRYTEAGENLSDRESVVSGVVTRNLRRKENKKAQAKVQKQYLTQSMNFNIQLYRKNLNFLTQKIVSGCLSWIWIFFPSQIWILDPGVKKAGQG